MRFYVYVHEFASGRNEGRPFYVGKGSGRRAWSISTRSKYWHSVAVKYGFKVKIIDSDISEGQANELLHRLHEKVFDKTKSTKKYKIKAEE